MLEEHLGGHNNKTHLDKGVMNWCINTLDITSYLDIGCGPGGMVELAEKKNLKVLGIDGDHTLKRKNPSNFLLHDFTKGPAPIKERYDLGWSVEFVEHVYEEYQPNYMPAFQQCKYVIMTYAPPGWNGHHHVNLQEEKYWIDKFKEYGLLHVQAYTDVIRQVSTMNYPKKPKKAFVRNRGLFFVNERN
jgi:SAM-dependent methyltransferase